MEQLNSDEKQNIFFSLLSVLFTFSLFLMKIYHIFEA